MKTSRTDQAEQLDGIDRRDFLNGTQYGTARSIGPGRSPAHAASTARDSNPRSRLQAGDRWERRARRCAAHPNHRRHRRRLCAPYADFLHGLYRTIGLDWQDYLVPDPFYSYFFDGRTPGRVRVFDGPRTLNELGEREVFGEMAVLDDAPRMASVAALEPTLLLRLDQETLYELMADRIEVARGIIRVLSSRLRALARDGAG